MIYRLLPYTLALLLGCSALAAQSLPDAATATRRADAALADVNASVHNRVIFNSNAEALETLLSDYQPRLSMTQVEHYREELEKARAEFKMHSDEEDIARLISAVDELEQQWDALRLALAGDISPASRDAAISDLRRDIDKLRAEQARLPAEQVRAVGNRIALVANSFEGLVGADAAAEQLSSLNSYWQRDSAEMAGWEQETPIDFATYSSTQSASSRAFGLPKTLAIFELATQKLAQAQESGEAPQAYVAQLTDVRTRSRARLLATLQTLVDAGEAKAADDASARESMNLLDEQLRITLAAPSDADFGALAGRTQRWLQAAADSDVSSEEGRARYYQRMTVSASAAWPEMERQFAVVRGFDPNDPKALEGQLIRIETDNLMGWRFKVGDFPFATTISGMPVAAVYDADVEAAIVDIETKLGRALGDSDDDGRWTIIAEVTGRMGHMQLRKQVEGDVRDADTGEKLGTYRGEEAEGVDAPILRIVAAHVGPLAVARGVGVAKVDGSLAASPSGPSGPGSAPSGTSAGSTSGSLLTRMPALLLGLLAAALCAAQARPTAARAFAERQGLGQWFDRSRAVLPLLGMVLAALGVYWLLSSRIIGDLLPALALTAAGLYAALPLLQGRGWLAPAQLERLQAHGLLLAVLTAVLAGTHLLAGGQWLI